MEVTPSYAATARQRVVPILDASGVAEARRVVGALGAPLLDATAAGELALAVTEAASNIVKHAREGAVVARMIEHKGRGGVEVLAIDKGRGMENVAAAMRDGHSTAGSPGSGLGALQRVASGLEVWSRPGGGTILRFEVWPKAGAAPPVAATGVICVAKPGEDVCGDGWAMLQGRGRVVVFLVDGLGHGIEAAQAARAAIEVVQAKAHLDGPDLMDAVHGALRPTRGAAAALALLQPESELCTFCGIGNIAASIRAGGVTRNMVSHNGILGHHVRKVQEFQYPFPKGALLVMHSDGLATRWDLAAYPGLEARHPALAAAALYRDFSRGRDDLTVFTLRNSAGGSP